MTSEASFGHYRLERVLGTGTFATVWLAHDVTLDRQVAIKILADNWSRDLDVRRRFLSEARVLLTAESTRITRGFELGETDDERPYLVMTWADRGTLDDRVAARRREGAMFAVHEAAAIVRQVALALADVHALGHLHRDVKPSNVLIRSAGSDAVPGLEPDEQVLIGDFGLARGIDASAITLVAGSPGYVAPEQAAGLTQLDRRADLYSLGRIMLELLTGDPGGRATTMAGAAAERVDAAEVLDEHRLSVPHDVLVLIEQLVDAGPAQRPATADEVAARLEPFTDAAAVLLAVPASPSPARRPRPRRRVVAAGLGLALAAVVAFVAVVRFGDDGGGTTTATTATTATPASGVPVTVPMPPLASLDERATDETRGVAIVSLEVEDVVAHFSSPPAPWRTSGDPVRDGDTVTMTLDSGSRQATVRIAPDAGTAGPGVSRIVIDYDP